MAPVQLQKERVEVAIRPRVRYAAEAVAPAAVRVVYTVLAK